MLVLSTFILAFLQMCFAYGLDEDLTITVAVFSGRPDPVWKVSSKVRTQKTQYQNIRGMLATAKTFLPVQMPPRLGYKGFLVQEGQKDEYLIVGPETKDLQLLLLASRPQDSVLLEDNIKEIETSISSIKAQEVPKELSSTIRPKRYAPPYLPHEWFLDPKKRKCNNCYNYANNMATYTFAQPGEASGLGFQLNNAQTVVAAAVGDQLVNIPNSLTAVLPNPGQHEHFVALVVDPGSPRRAGDFHWYRLDGQWNMNRWSHKPGKAIPTNSDNNGHFIIDPRPGNNVAMGYYRFVTFMRTRTSGAGAVDLTTNLYPPGCAPSIVG